MRARARVQRRAVDELRCRRVLGDVAHRLVDGDLGGRRAAARATGSTAPSSVPAAGRGPRAPRSRRAAARTPGASRRTAAPLARAPGPARRPAARTPPTSRVSRARRRRPTRPARTPRWSGRSRPRPRSSPRRSRAEPPRPDRAPPRGSANDRTSGSMRRCARACTPEPTTASTDASSRASARVDNAAAAARAQPRDVLAVHQSQAGAGRGVEERHAPLGAARGPRPTLPGKTPTSLTTTGLFARRPAIVSTAPRSASTDCRGGAEKAPDESACKAPETASSSASGAQERLDLRTRTGSARPRRLLQV